jgi:flagellar biosynthesis/type III secretory pathway protein FliH
MFLRRTDTVSMSSKERIRHKMESKYQNILKEGYFAQQMLAEGKEEGLAEGLAEGIAVGKAEGVAVGMGASIIEYIKARFPGLTALAEQQVGKLTNALVIHELSSALFHANDVNTAKILLESVHE